MTLRIVFFLLFGYGVGSAQNTAETASNSFISWAENYSLSWNDFQGPPDENYTMAALTSYKIDLLPEAVMVDENDQIQGYENLTVVANFYKNSSWHSTISDHILQHERLHFDIAELFARKIRRRFSELKKGKQASFSVYQDAFNLFWKQCRNMQKQYDRKTNHGGVIEINKEWQERILKELKSLDDFKQT